MNKKKFSFKVFNLLLSLAFYQCEGNAHITLRHLLSRNLGLTRKQFSNNIIGEDDTLSCCIEPDLVVDDEDRIYASDHQEDNGFGRTTAMYGDLLVIGAPLFDKDDRTESVGQAYLFRVNETNTEEINILDTGNDGGSWKMFGISISVGDEYIAVGSFSYVRVFSLTGVYLRTISCKLGGDACTFMEPGLATHGEKIAINGYLNGNYRTFIYNATDGELLAMLTKGNGRVRDLAMSDEAIVVSFWDENEYPSTFVYSNSDDDLYTLIAEIPESGNAIDTLGDRIIIGVSRYRTNEGALFIYSTSGELIRHLKFCDTNSFFGVSVAMSKDNIIVKGEYGNAALIYSNDDEFQLEKTILTAKDPCSSTWRGGTVSISDSHFVIGNTNEDSAYVYKL